MTFLASRSLHVLRREAVCVACTPRLPHTQHILFQAQRRAKGGFARSTRSKLAKRQHTAQERADGSSGFLDSLNSPAASTGGADIPWAEDGQGEWAATEAEYAENRKAQRLAKRLRRLQDGTFKPKTRQGKVAQGETPKPYKAEPRVVRAVRARLEEIIGPYDAPQGAQRTPSAVRPDRDSTVHTSRRGPHGAASAVQTRSGTDKGARVVRVMSDAEKEEWQKQKGALQRKFGTEGWKPSKRLSPDILPSIRALAASNPELYTVELIAKEFNITPEAIRRILKSKWQPSAEEAEARHLRWENRGLRKWKEMAEKGMRPPGRWRAMGVQPVARTATGKPLWIPRWKARSFSPPST